MAGCWSLLGRSGGRDELETLCCVYPGTTEERAKKRIGIGVEWVYKYGMQRVVLYVLRIGSGLGESRNISCRKGLKAR